MKSKYFILLLLVSALGLIIYSMIKIEDRYVTIIPQRDFDENLDTAARADDREEALIKSDENWSKIINSVQLVARAFDDNISIVKTMHGTQLQKNEISYEPQFLRGVNLGVATPGFAPGEFGATKEQYYQWLVDIGRMNANTIRIYTILPPDFYATFEKYNHDHPERPLFLIQGVWTELPEKGDYFEKVFFDGFKREMRDAVDVIFGNANISPRPGHASGKYVVDVSMHTLGFIIGREWEPQSITSTNRAHRELTNYKGRFFSVPRGRQMEVFLADCMDYLMSYETAAHGFQHPVSFVNWLPLDPMYHNSEWLEGEKVSEFDNDLEIVDPMNIFTTPSNKAGYFASYHVYPYYPDFIYNDSAYRESSCSKGQCTYAGYIHDLKAHHEGLPLVIAEYGVPSSRSSSHSMPLGLNQGAHTESEQGEINAHLTVDIFDTHCAGALIFSWIDEWFKHNWMVMEFEIPAERNKLWHNIEDPEQYFGVAALEHKKIEIDGQVEDWSKSKKASDKIGDIASDLPGYFDLKSLEVTSDATCLYLKIAFDSAIPIQDTSIWSKYGILAAIDIYDAEKGDRHNPIISDTLGRGAEFLLDIRGPGQTVLLVDDPYDVCNEYPSGQRPLYRSVNNANGVFNRQRMVPNRRRISLTGEEFPEVISYRGDLRWASNSESEPGASTLNDIAFCESGRSIEMRIPWALLNITDPSSLSVLDDNRSTDPLDYSKTDGIRIYLFTYRPALEKQAAVDRLPDDASGQGIKYTWKAWDKPEYKYRLKYGYDALQKIFGKIKNMPFPNSYPNNSQHYPDASLTQWPDGKAGAASVTFDDASYGQYKYGAPIIRKYHQGGTFFIPTSWIGEEGRIAGEEDGLQTLRLSWPQIRDIAESGFEIGSHGHEHTPLDSRVTDNWIKNSLSKGKKLIEDNLKTTCVSMSYPYSAITDSRMALMTKLGFRYGRRAGCIPNPFNIENFMSLYSYPVIDTSRPHYSTLGNILKKNEDQWTILLFHHIFLENATEWKTFGRHEVKDTYALTPLEFERYTRLIRNYDYAAGSVREIGDYIRVRRITTLNFGDFDKYYTISLNRPVDKTGDSVSLSIALHSPWRYVQLDGSAADGIYEIRKGEIIFNAAPGATIVVRNLAGE